MSDPHSPRPLVAYPDAVRTALGLMRSAVLSGESWSVELAAAYEDAVAALPAAEPAAGAPEPGRFRFGLDDANPAASAEADAALDEEYRDLSRDERRVLWERANAESDEPPALPPVSVGGREALLAADALSKALRAWVLSGLRAADWPLVRDFGIAYEKARLNTFRLQASPPTGVSDGVALDDQCPERCLGIVGHAGPHQTSDYDPDGLGAAWAEAEAALPEGWLFHGVELADHSMEGGGWGPDWMASMSWPGHCEYDCDHDEAFRVTHDDSPAAALLALAQRAREQADSEPGR